MQEKIHELLSRLSGILHWLGKYNEAKTLNSLCSFLIDNKIDYIDQLNRWNNPMVIELRSQLREMRGTITKAAIQDDESKAADIITDYYEAEIKTK